MPIKVCHLTSVHGPYDTRIFQKMCLTLADAGFDVYQVVANAQSEEKEGVHIVGVGVPFNSRLGRIRKAPKAVFEAAKKIDADIYHIHDPELLPYGVKLQRLGKHVIFDSHEDVPNDILDKEWLGPHFLRKTVSELYRIYENRQVAKLSGVISVLDSITKRFKHPTSITIHNYPRVEYFEVEKKVFEPEADKQFKLVYNGGLTKIRGIHNLVETMGYLDDQFSLLLMGPWESDEYRKECERLKGWSKVSYLGTLPIKDCFSVLKSCQLGMVVFLPVPNHIQSLPNKSFEYVASGLPMVMSDFSIWNQFFGDYAHFVNPDNPQDIAKKVMMIQSNYSKELEKIKIQGKRILNEYTWAKEGKRLIHFYRDILS